MTYLNYYKVLGLQADASDADIRRAYRILARRYHPDVNPGADSAEKFKVIAEAYRTLSNSSNRQQHDETLRARTTQRGYKAYTEEMRKQFQAQSEHIMKTKSSRSKRRHHKTNPAVTEPSTRKTLLDNLLKASRLTKERIKKVTPWSSREDFTASSSDTNGKDAYAQSLLVVEVHVTIEEAIHGAKKKVDIPQGKNTSLRISLQVPPGVTTGSTVRMRSPKLKGQEILCIVQLQPHPYLELSEQGLELELPISISEAYFGTTIDAPTLHEPVKIAIPAKSASGEKITLKGQGPEMRDGKRGDLIYRLTIAEVSGEISVDEQRFLRELSEKSELSPRGHLPRSLFLNTESEPRKN